MTSRIDDWDPDRVKFEGSWAGREVGIASQGTITVSERVGDKVTAQFSGTALEVWGSGISSSLAERSFMGFNFLIDNQFVKGFSQGVPFEPEFNISRLWASPELPFGEHTIDVEIAQLQNAAVVIDHFPVYSAGAARDVSTSGRIEIFTAATTSSRTVTSVPTESSVGEASSISTGPIIGAVIGGTLFIIILLVLMAIWLYKRRRRVKGRKLEATPYDDTMDPSALSPRAQSEAMQDLVSPPQSSSARTFTLPQSKMRSRDDTPPINPLLVLPQPKVRPSANNPQIPSQSPSSSNLSPSTITKNSNSSQDQDGTSTGSAGPTNTTDSPDSSREVVEAIRTLQTYLQRQPQGLGQVAQGLGMAGTADHGDTLNPPPAYDERH